MPSLVKEYEELKIENRQLKDMLKSEEQKQQ
jgi:cell shape-determining protein MreC